MKSQLLSRTQKSRTYVVIGITTTTLLASATVAQGASLVIDNFDDTYYLANSRNPTVQQVRVGDINDPVNYAAGDYAYSNGVAGDILGGERDAFISDITDSSGKPIVNDLLSVSGDYTNEGSITSATGSARTGRLTLIYDGNSQNNPNDTIQGIDYGLGGINFLDGYTAAETRMGISVVGSVSENVNLAFTLYSSETETSFGELSIAGDSGNLNDITARTPFSIALDEFINTDGFNAESVKAVKLEITGDKAYDIELDDLQVSYSPSMNENGDNSQAVPEGNTILGTLIAGAFLGFLRFRKRITT